MVVSRGVITLSLIWNTDRRKKIYYISGSIDHVKFLNHYLLTRPELFESIHRIKHYLADSVVCFVNTYSNNWGQGSRYVAQDVNVKFQQADGHDLPLLFSWSGSFLTLKH